MPLTELPALDADEYLHLALHASQHGEHHSALQYLKATLLRDPGHALALHLLAAEHAEIGLYRQARAEFRRALELRPDLEPARFQLGLLHLQLGEHEDAAAAFAVLAHDARDTSLCRFSRALGRMIDGDLRAAQDGLADGIATCRNAALAADMQRVLDGLGAPPEVVGLPRRSGYLGAYGSPDGEHVR